MITPKQECYYTLTDNELDALIQVHFNKPGFNCVTGYKWNNDSDDSVHAGIVAIGDIGEGKDYHTRVQAFITTESRPPFLPHWRLLLAELARRGIVPEGDYLIIESCW